jgi:hypothetical protein
MMHMQSGKRECLRLIRSLHHQSMEQDDRVKPAGKGDGQPRLLGYRLQASRNSLRNLLPTRLNARQFP